MEKRYETHFLNEEKISSIYFSNGFVIVKNIFSKEEIEICKDQLIQICSKFLDEDFLDLEAALKKIFEKSTFSYLQILRTFSKSIVLQSLFLKKEVINLLYNLNIKTPIQSTQPVTHSTSHDLLVNGENVGIEAHQDWPSIQGSLDSLVMWVPFTELDESSYPIQILPKSHFDGLRKARVDKKGSIIDLTLEEENHMLDVICEPGDVVLFSTFTVHRTKSYKEKGRFRFSVSTRFDNAYEKTFMNRNYPCAYKRYVEREIHQPISQKEIQDFFKVLQK